MPTLSAVDTVEMSRMVAIPSHYCGDEKNAVPMKRYQCVALKVPYSPRKVYTRKTMEDLVISCW